MRTRGAMLVAAMAACATILVASDGPEQFGAHWARVTNRARIEFLADAARMASGGGTAERLYRTLVMKSGAGRTTTVEQSRTGTITGLTGVKDATAVSATPGVRAGVTFEETPISPEHGVIRLTRRVTSSRLQRALFSSPRATAAYYRVRYTRSAPYVRGTYLQFVVDETWNRIVYGNLNRWIRSHDGLSRPTSIAVDPSGRVFVGESGGRRVTVLQIEGEGDAATLRPIFVIRGFVSVAALAHSDHGTPLEPSDDLLYVVDQSAGSVRKFLLTSSTATAAGSFEGFDSPTALAVGRWDGVNTPFLYVVDGVGKRLRVFEDTGSELSPVGEYKGDYRQYFGSIATDHFGNIYLGDQTGSALIKLSALLEPLDETGGETGYDGLAGIHIPFGRIEVEGEETRWAGFDQVFALERWTEESGARRLTLGTGVRDLSFNTDADVSMVSGAFVLTDFGVVSMRIDNASGQTVRVLAASAMTSGTKSFTWDRRDESGRDVPPGEYTFRLSATSPYREETATAVSRWTLPLYYEETAERPSTHLVQGTILTAGSRSYVVDQSAVEYRFTGLQPGGSYSVAAEYGSPDGQARVQDMTTGDGSVIHGPVSVGSVRIAFTAIPAAAYASGELVLRVNRKGGPDVSVERLILKETGKSFAAGEYEPVVPVTFGLEQNYPNPFNGTSNLEYRIPSPGPVRLAVYDLVGREIAVLVNEVKAPGTYRVRFDATGLASGVYLYRLTAGNAVQTRKMVYVR